MVIVPIVVKAHAKVNRVILYSTLLYNYVFPWVKGGEKGISRIIYFLLLVNKTTISKTKCRL